jgi:hypothetical protein
MTEPKSSAWLDAFAKQVSSGKLFIRCRRYARACLDEYRLKRGPQYPDELVQDALGDTFEGRIAWDPARKALDDHVCDTIRFRIRDEKQSAPERRPTISIDRPLSDDAAARGDADDEQRQAARKLRAEIESAVGLAEDPEATLMRKQERELGARIADELTRLAGSDDEVRLLVACLRDGDDERRDVCAETGMSEKAFHNARRRLVRLKNSLPDELRVSDDEDSNDA